MLIDRVYKLVQQVVNKNQSSGYIDPEEFSKYAEMAQLELVSDTYNNPPLGYENTQEITDNLSSFKVEVIKNVVDGKFDEPSDYMNYSSCRATTFAEGSDELLNPYQAELDFLKDSEIARRLASEIDAPSVEMPAIAKFSTYFRVYPSDVKQVRLTYLKTPLLPWWNYTLSSGRPVFAETGGVSTNPNTGVTAGDSTDFTLTSDMIHDLVYKISSYFSVEVRESDVYQMVKAQEQ